MSENLVLGRGKVFFSPYPKGATTGGTKGYFGNTPELTMAVSNTNLDHYSAEGGLKIKDKSVQLQTDVTLTFSTDNISIANVMLWFGGNNTGSEPSDAPTDIGSLAFIGTASQIYGSLFFESDNPVGDNLNYWFPYVAIRPNGNYALKGDVWQSLSFTGEALKRDSLTERFYAYTPAGGVTSSDAALDTITPYLDTAHIGVATAGVVPATGGTVTGHAGVHAAASTIEYTLTGGNEGWAFYHNGTVNVGSAHAAVGPSGSIATVLPVAGTYTVKLYDNVGGTGSAVATSGSITIT